MANITITETTPVVSVNTTSNVVTVTNDTTNVIISNVAVASQEEIRKSLSVTDTGGDGSLSYSNVTGVFTFAGPSAAETRAHFSATSPINLSSGVISIDSSALFSGKTTDDLTEGSTNLYYTNARVNAYIIDNGLDFNAEKVDNRVANLMVAGANLTYTYDDGANSLTLTQQLKTQDITEGDNLYFTDDRVLTTLGRELALGNQAGALSVDVSNASLFTATLTGNITNISFDNVVTPNYSATFILTQDGTGGHVIDPSSFTGWEFTNNDYHLDTAAGDKTLLTVVVDGSDRYASVVGFTDDTTVANLTVTGTATVTGNVNSGPIYAVGNSTIVGDLQVNGNISYVNVEDLLVEDNSITLNFGNATARDAFIYVDRSGTGGGTNAHIKWNETDNDWEFYDGTTTYNMPKSTSDLAEGTNLYFTGARARGNISVGTPASASSGGALAYNSSSGEFTFTPADVQTDSEVRALLSTTTSAASGGGSLAYDSGTGVFTFAPADLSAKIELTNLSVTTATASGDGSLAYDNTSGVFTFTPADAGLSDYGDSNVVTLLSAFGSNTISSTEQIATTGNINVGNYLNFAGNTATTSDPKIKYEGALGDGQLTFTKSIVGAETKVGIFDSSEASYDLANTAIGGIFGAGNIVVNKDLIVDGSTANITTTANISAGNVLTDHIISASGQPLQLKGQTDGIELDKTIATAESRIFDTDTTGYSVATADFGSANVTLDKVPSMVIQAAGTAGTNTLTATLLFGGGFGPVIAGRSNPASALLYDFNIVNTGTGLGPAMQAPTDLDLNLAGWFVYDIASGSTTSKLPVNAHVTGISGNTITLSENLTSDISYGGSGYSVVLFPGAYSSSQDIGFSIAGDDTSSVTYDYAISRYNGYNLPETLSNVTLDRVSYGDSTVDMANVVMRHIADVETGPDSAIRIPRAMLIGANASPDLLSIGTGTALPATSTLGLTIEQDGLTDYGATETTPQMKLMLNNYQTNSLASKTTYPTWSEFLGQSGNATVDMPYLGAPAFNFKHLGGTKDTTAASSEGEIPGRITFNALTGTGAFGSDQVNPPASITTMVGGTGALTSMANLDMYFQSTSATAYRNGPYVGDAQGDASGGSIPQTFLASKSGSTVLASNQAGTISLRPARDYAQSGNASSYVDNRYADNLHDYHTFLEANWENPAGRTGSRVTINAKSGQTNGATPSGSDFNYDSIGDASLRFRTHNSNSSVKASWDIEASQSSNNLAIIDSLNDGSPTTVIDISGNSVHVDRRLRLQNLTTAEINALGSPQAGDTVFNTTETSICFYNGSSWQVVSSSNL